MSLRCPKCGNSDQGQMMGHEVRGVYDGVLWWECMACGWGWPRDFGLGWLRRNQAACHHADAHNRGATR